MVLRNDNFTNSTGATSASKLVEETFLDSLTFQIIIVGIFVLLMMVIIGVISAYVYIRLKSKKDNGLEDFEVQIEPNESHDQYRNCQSSFEGNLGAFDPGKDLKSQVDNIPYDTKREIPRDRFKIGVKIGTGNFGKVYKGILTGLYESKSQTIVAIKSIVNEGSGNGFNDLISEIKLMSYIKPHANLVSMIASCSSELQTHGQLRLLIEYCEHGDLQNYLKNNENRILSGNADDAINSRCLLKWAYGIAKGMQYLEEVKIMHGDLAARNILLAEDPSHKETLLAKVADFGLAKQFYKNTSIYEKTNRLLVPWKWMALEYLEDDYFTLKSDVWSYGVLLWEIMAFGRQPYGHKEYDEVLEQLQSGYRLPFPNRVKDGLSWSPKSFYAEISQVCFIGEPTSRNSFSEVAHLVRNFLSGEENSQYRELTLIYRKTRAEKYLNT